MIELAHHANSLSAADGAILFAKAIAIWTSALALIGWALFKLPDLYERVARRLFGIKETHQSDAP